MQLTLVSEQSLGCGATCFRRRGRAGRLGQLLAKLGQISVTLRQLGAEFIGEAVVWSPGASPAIQPAEQKAEDSSSQEADQQVSSGWHRILAA
jgi:hypothetical protein